jgi:DNA-binding SARP family transcriptional activator
VISSWSSWASRCAKDGLPRNPAHPERQPGRQARPPAEPATRNSSQPQTSSQQTMMQANIDVQKAFYAAYSNDIRRRSRATKGSRMDFRILGHIEVEADDLSLDIGHARQRAVLATLVLASGQPVSAEMIIDRVWGDDTPRTVRSVLYCYVARLRDALRTANVALTRRAGGYALQIDSGEVDAFRFRQLVARAAKTTDDDQAAALLRQALALWRGEALAGLTSPWLSAMRSTLENQRIAAMLQLNDIDLRQGRHGMLVADLIEQAASHPMDERLISQLMLALYRSGRQSEALQWFERTRRQLAEDLGVCPGSALQVARTQILQGDLRYRGEIAT